MHKTSVTFPAFEWQRDGMAMDDMACKGLTARMHQKITGEDDRRSQSRRKESSLMPPITPRKLSASSQPSSSTKDHDGSARHGEKSETKMANFDVYEETGYLEIGKLSDRSMADKISKRGHKLYTLHETKKLPEILKPKAKASDNSTRKRKGQTKKEKKKVDRNSTLSGLQDTATPTTVTGDESELQTDQFSEWKYEQDWKRRLDWNFTRPFTFSYFPQIRQKRKKKDGAESTNSRTKKVERKGIATPRH